MHLRNYRQSLLRFFPEKFFFPSPNTPPLILPMHTSAGLEGRQDHDRAILIVMRTTTSSSTPLHSKSPGFKKEEQAEVVCKENLVDQGQEHPQCFSDTLCHPCLPLQYVAMLVTSPLSRSSEPIIPATILLLPMVRNRASRLYFDL